MFHSDHLFVQVTFLSMNSKVIIAHNVKDIKESDKL
jgi:hypothetical protein